MTKKIFLHLGMHKTGSTLLQLKALKTAIPENVSVISVHHDEKLEYRMWRKRFANLRNMVLMGKVASGDETITQMAQMVEDLITQTDQENLIWSDENILGAPPGHRIAGKLPPTKEPYPNSALVASCFERLSSTYDIHVRFYKREHLAVMKSLYKDFISKLVEYVDFSEFCQRVDIEAGNWGSILDPWKRTFEDTVSIAEFSLGREPEMTYINEFRSWCRLRELQETEISDQVVNKGISDRQVDFARAVSQFVNRQNRSYLSSALRSIN